MGDPDLRAMQLDPERTYLREAPFGSMDPQERLKLLDAEGIDAVVLYTTIGLLWEAELDDVELSQAYTRAYNQAFPDDGDRRRFLGDNVRDLFAITGPASGV